MPDLIPILWNVLMANSIQDLNRNIRFDSRFDSNTNGRFADLVFCGMQNFAPSCGIYPFPRNFYVFAEFDKGTNTAYLQIIICLSVCYSHEAMTDLVALMSSLVDHKAHILVPHIYDDVQQLMPDEATSYDTIDFDMASTLIRFTYLLTKS